ncbi:MAG: beta galactosidase jelly roll domain-containing protein [Ekhidna sp.]
MKSITLLLLITLPLLGMGQKAKVLNLATDWRFTIGDREEYSTIDYDDSNWEEIQVPSAWENEGFANYNGFAWYRFTFDGADLKGFSNLFVNLGYIDDVHEAYLNETLIGFKGSFPPDYYTAYDALNEYPLPEKTINREGKNVLAVKVYDLVKDGGIVKGNVGIYFNATIEKSFYSLEGIWKFTTERKPFWEQVGFKDDAWDNIVVPSFWRSKHIKRSNGFGWYRKEFVLPDNLKNQDIYMVLGKIDDFDYTYVNGKLVGRTKDYKPFGESNSYQEFRIYKIPKELLKQEGNNVIAVQVEDIGIDAGIYEGPIGLTTQVSKKSAK